MDLQGKVQMAASVQCSNAKLIVWALVLVALSVISMLVGVVKDAYWPMVVCASVSVLLFLLLFVVMFTKTARAEGGTGNDTETEKECHCVWAGCKFGELDTSTPAGLVFSLVSVKTDLSDVENTSNTTWTAVTTVNRTLSASISSQKACACCLEDFDADTDVAVLPCGHVYHEECIARWVLRSAKEASCPTCRTPFDHAAETIVAI